MSSPRASHTATLRPNGTVLVAGGSSYAEVYDPGTGTWSPAASMIRTRYNHTATLLSTGDVLVAGGADSTTNYMTATELFKP
jgi:hypothetical protein